MLGIIAISDRLAVIDRGRMMTMSIEISDIAKEIDRLCKEKGISRYALAKKAGIPDSTVRNMFQKGSKPNFDTLELICKGLDMTVAEFFSQSELFENFTKDQTEMMDLYDRMDEKSRQLVLAYAKGIMADYK